MSIIRNYLDINAVYPEASEAAMEAGKRRYYNNKVKDLAVETDGEGEAIVASVEGNFEYKVNINFDSSGNLRDYSCTCNDFSHSRGPCKHIVAAALAFQEKYPLAERKTAAAQPSDVSVVGLISDFSRARNIRFMGERGKVGLKPELNYSDGCLTMRLYVGLKKKYIVRDIRKFVSDFEVGELRRYGASLELYSSYQSFDTLSAQFVKFIISIVKERENCLIAKDTLRLNGEETDRIFDLFTGKLVYLNESETGSGDRIIEKPDSFVLSVMLNAENDGYRLSLRDDIVILYGSTVDYIVTTTNIYPCINEDYIKLEKLLNGLKAKRTLYIAGNDFPTFYNGVLKHIERLDITTDIELKDFEAPPFRATVYLDYREAEIVADISAAYGDVEVDIFNESFPTVAVRDYDAERGMKAAVATYFDLPRLAISDEKKIFEFMRYGLSRIYNYADIVMSESMKQLRPKRGIRLHAGIKLSGGLLEVKLSDEEFSEEELKKIYDAVRMGREYVKISGQYVDLSDATIDPLRELMALGKGRSNFTLPSFYAPYLNSAFDNYYLDDAKAQMTKALDELKRNEIADALPASYDNIMRPYQKTGYAWLMSLLNIGCGGILADDMGLGKSLQTIAMISSPRISRCLIICPTTLILNWIAEFKKFAPDIPVFAVMGQTMDRCAEIEAFDKGVLITSYELIRRDYERYKDIMFDLAVIDEAQYIKNPDTKNALSVKSINAGYRFALTGTPIENSLSELWSIFDFIMPGYLGTYADFRDNLEQKIVIGDEKAEKKLESMIAPFVLRRLKSDVLTELPPKIETEIHCPLVGTQRELYMNTLALAKHDYEFNKDKMRRSDALAVLSRLRQICCHPGLIDPDYTGNSSKLEAALELISEGVKSGRKILVFSQFTSMIDVLRMKLAEMGIAGYLLRGDTPKSERLMLVNRFNSDSTPVFFISLLAGGTGLNLTGADMVIHYDPWWNTSVMEQATDRAYRIGQDKPVNVYRLLMEDSVERKIRSLQLKKQKLGQNFIREHDKIDPEQILKSFFGEEN